MDTGTRIAHLRRQRGVSRRQFAEALGVNQSTVAYWERGETTPRQKHFGRLLTYFGLTLVEFYSMPLPGKWLA